MLNHANARKISGRDYQRHRKPSIHNCKMAEKPEAASTGSRNELIFPPHPPPHEPTETASPIAGSQLFSLQSGHQPSSALSQPGLIDERLLKSGQVDMHSLELAMREKMKSGDIVAMERMMQMFLASGKSEYLYVFGGDSEHSVERYDLFEKEWEPVRVAMPDKRSRFGVTSFRKEAWLVGGTTDEDRGMDWVISFNPLQNNFVIREPMPTGRHSLGVAELNDQLYAVGGISEGAVYSVTEVFRFGYGWKCIGFMNKQRYDFGIASHRNKLYVAGGNDGTSLVDVVEEFTVTNDTWQLLNGEWRNHSKLLHGRMCNDLVSGGLIGLDKLYAVGTAAPEALLDITWNKTWNSLIHYRPKRDRENLCAIGHDKFIFLIGGDMKTGNLKETVKDADCYDTIQNTWSKIGPMGKARTRAGVVLFALENM